jgi:hypothetical protein
VLSHSLGQRLPTSSMVSLRPTLRSHFSDVHSPQRRLVAPHAGRDSPPLVNASPCQQSRDPRVQVQANGRVRWSRRAAANDQRKRQLSRPMRRGRRERYRRWMPTVSGDITLYTLHTTLHHTYYITFFVWPYILYTIVFVFLLINKSEDVLIDFRRTLIHITSL